MATTVGIDMVKLMTQHIAPLTSLSGTYDIVEDNGPGKDSHIFRVKNPQGFPVDHRIYDDNLIYDAGTEYNKPGWTDPTAVKIHCNGMKGNPICTRFVMGLPSPEMVNYNSNYMIFTNGQWDFVQRGVNATRYSMGAPYLWDWGGDVGIVKTFPLNYQWGGIGSSYSDLEEYFYAPPFGLVHWQHSTLNKTTGLYDLVDNPGILNKLLPLQMAKLVYPIMVGH